jgi:hypothetical protein
MTGYRFDGQCGQRKGEGASQGPLSGLQPLSPDRALSGKGRHKPLAVHGPADSAWSWNKESENEESAETPQSTRALLAGGEGAMAFTGGGV